MTNSNGDRGWLPSAQADRRGVYTAGPKTPAELKRPPASVIAPVPNGRAGTGTHQP